MSTDAALVPTHVMCREAGIRVRLLYDRCETGLIAKPLHTSLGEGGGRGSQEGLWAPEQLKLLKLVQQKRSEGAGVVELCNVPVALWLYFDTPGIPIEQLIRVIKTWAAGTQSRTQSRPRARKTARQLGRQLAPRGNTREQREWTQREIQALTETAEDDATNRTFEPTAWETALASVMDAHNEGRSFAGPAECPVTPSSTLFGMRTRRAAIDRIDTFTACDFDLARHIHLSGLVAYLELLPQLTGRPEGAHIYQAPNLQELLNRACVDLLGSLGIIALRPDCAPQIAARMHSEAPIRLWAASPTSPMSLR